MSKAVKMGFWSIVLLTINSIIGSGIFLTPGGVVKSSGKLAPLVYLCAAAFAACLAITFAAASKYVSKGGAAYAYAKAGFGDKVGLYVGVTRFFSAAIAWGVMATAVVRTTFSIFGVDPSNGAITIGFLVLMLILLIVNMVGTKILTLISNLSTIGKMVALGITIVAGGWILISTGQNHFNEINNLVASGEIPQMNPSLFVMSVVSAFYAFTGFESIASGSQDMEKPEVNLPRAIPLGVGIIAVFYIGIVLVSMMLNPEALALSKEVVVLAAVFDQPLIKGLIIIGALVSMFGINVAASFHTPRVIEAMAQEKQFPAIFAKRLENGFPLIAFMLTATLAIAVPIAFDYQMSSIMVISAISRFVQFIIVPLAVILFYLGKSKEPVLNAVKSKFTDFVFPILSIILTVVLLMMFDWAGQFTTDGNINVLAILAMIVGYVVIPFAVFVYDSQTKKSLS
ncbi:APC family permease [Erysipelothrix sp. HDW6C]|uniref:APC family permease n=1 Tax=Erysipelothrix sp. HDW6C TaxID=2714930 RepID=UPI0014075EA7|nr:APC family permease [Erysipelothrix sp. HDW6C]QIK70106.1 APC family permease [Erysipelothrix sp. HDW6C]